LRNIFLIGHALRNVYENEATAKRVTKNKGARFCIRY